MVTSRVFQQEHLDKTNCKIKTQISLKKNGHCDYGIPFEYWGFDDLLLCHMKVGLLGLF